MPGLITLRPLPAGFVAVFSSAAAAEAATIAHRQFPHDVGGEGEGADWPRDLSLALPGGERRCRARPRLVTRSEVASATNADSPPPRVP